MPSRPTPLSLEVYSNGEMAMQLPSDFDYYDDDSIAHIGAILDAIETPERLTA